jgi:hypothetical protein
MVHTINKLSDLQVISYKVLIWFLQEMLACIFNHASKSVDVRVVMGLFSVHNILGGSQS